MKKFMSVLLLLVIVWGEGMALEVPLAEKWRVTIGKSAPVIADYWSEEGVPRFLVYEGNFAFIFTSGREKWMSEGMPGNVIALNRVVFPDPIGGKVIAAYKYGNHAEIARCDARRLDSLTIINKNYFGSYVIDMGSPMEYNYEWIKTFIRPDSLTEPNDFYVTTLTSSGGYGHNSGWSRDDGEMHTISLDGLVKNDYLRNHPSPVPAGFARRYSDKNGNSLFLLAGREGGSSYDKWHSQESLALILQRNYFDEDTALTRMLAFNSENFSRGCRLYDCILARMDGADFVYPLFSTGNEVEYLSKLSLEDLIPQDSLVLPTRSAWSEVAVDDPANGGESTLLLLISNRGDVIPVDLADFSLGETYELGFTVTKAFGWDGDGDGTAELYIQSGKELICYEMPALGVSHTLAPVPRSPALRALYPNPFNSTLTVTFTVPKLGNTTVGFYDASGREVARLFDGSMGMGSHTVSWDAGEIAAGSYIVRVTQGGETVSRTVQLIK